tara:strand:+ start:6361 stop:7098 length:738 start_codon:yes stop_codon:yes gene_type:complete
MLKNTESENDMEYDNSKFEMRDCFGICDLPSLLWQKADQGAFGRIVAGKPVDGPILDLALDAPKWMELVSGRDVVVQAGGNQGMYPKYYAGLFKKVYTFEPDEDNYFCLDYNCQGTQYHKQKVGLGESNTTMNLVQLNVNNTGMHRTVSDEVIKANPNIPTSCVTKVEMITLDSLNIEACDLLQLDVELYETEALVGAEETIKKYSPIIVVETGNRPSPADGYLNLLGYKMHSQLRMDAIYVKNN